MYICEKCHNARQNRKALESQPLQFTGYEYSGKVNCPDCGKYQKAGVIHQYLTAFELVQELEEMKEKQARIARPESFPVQGYHSVADMFERSKIFPAILQDVEAMQNALQYASEIESIIEAVQP